MTMPKPLPDDVKRLVLKAIEPLTEISRDDWSFLFDNVAEAIMEDRRIRGQSIAAPSRAEVAK